MNAHPDLFVFNETHWIANFYEVFGTAKVPVGDLLDVMQRTRFVDGSRTTEIDMEAFKAAQNGKSMMTPAAFSDAVGLFFAAEEGKTLWADKTPDYGYCASMLQLYWPDCRIIHLIRDGARVARSMAQHPGYRALVAHGRQHWGPLSIDFRGFSGREQEVDRSDFVDLWYRRLLRIRNESERLKPGSYLEIRHEDVIADPAGTLRTIADFTDLRSDETWLRTASDHFDAKKISRPRPVGILKCFRPRHLALMRELGYKTDLPERREC